METHVCDWFMARPEIKTPTAEFGTMFIAARCRVCGEKKIWYEGVHACRRYLITRGAFPIYGLPGQTRADMWLAYAPTPWATAAVAALRRIEAAAARAALAAAGSAAQVAREVPAVKPAAALPDECDYIRADMRKLAMLISTYLPVLVENTHTARPSAEEMAAWASKLGSAPIGIPPCLTQPSLL